MSSTKTARMPKTGFPVASKVLMKYDRQRAHRQHHQKMQDMRHGLDNTSPEQYPHLVVRMKRLQKEEERQMIIDHENEILVKKMRKIMTRKGRLDNWNNNYQPKTLNTPYRERQLEQIAVDNMGIAKRLERVGPVYHVKEWEDDFHRHEEILERRADETKDYEDTSTPHRQKRLSKTRQQKQGKQTKETAAEDKYEDDFESDNESTAGERDKEGNETERSKSMHDSQDDEQTPKLPKIETKKKETTAKDKDQRSSKVSKLPAVNQSKKESVEDRFAVYRDKKFETKLKKKSQQKKSNVNSKSSSATGTKDKPVPDDTESTGGSAVRESSPTRGGNDRAERMSIEDPETGEYGEVLPGNTQSHDQNLASGREENAEHQEAGNGSQDRVSSPGNVSGVTIPSSEQKTEKESDERVSSAGNLSTVTTQSANRKSTTDTTHQERVASAGNVSTTTSQSAERKSAKDINRSLQSIQTHRTEDAVSIITQSEGGTTLAESDAKHLFRVCKELEKPEDIFIKTLIRRTYNQRMQTKSKFRDLYDLELMTELGQTLGEPWHALINALLTEKETSDVSTVHSALQNKDFSSIVEILCTRNTNSLNNLKEAYRKEYAISLESDISETTEDPVQLLLLTLLKGGRTESNDVDEDEAEKDARELYESGEGRWTSDTGKFIRLVEQKNAAQFKNILNLFKQISGGKDILVSARQDLEGKDDYLEALSTLINCSKGPQMYFSEKLHGCKNLEDPSFVNILVSRAETDMPGTRKMYKKRYGKELSDDISSRGPHVTLRVLQELVNRPAPGQNKAIKGQGAKKLAGNQQPNAQSKKPAVRKPEKKEDAAAGKPNPLDKPGKRVMAEAKHKREVEEKGKAKQAAQKQEKNKSGKDSESDSAGTVHPAKNFDAEKDADTLYKAMDGLGTNEEKIVSILPRRSNSQRQKIKEIYNKKYNRDLSEDLKSELSGDFEELILALMMEPVEYDAYCLNDAVKGLGTDEAALVGILSTRSQKEIKAIKDHYQKAYKSSLEEDVSADTSNAFKQMLLELIKAQRDEGDAVDDKQAEDDAKKLFMEEKKSLCVTDGTLLGLLTRQNKSQIKATFEKYKEVAGHDVYEGIKLAMLGDDEDGYVGLAKASDDVVEFYATRLNHSMTGAVGTDEKMLIRILVSRSEIDLETIKGKYQQLYGKNLADSVEKECGGDFKKALLVILGQKLSVDDRQTTSEDVKGETVGNGTAEADVLVVQGEIQLTESLLERVTEEDTSEAGTQGNPSTRETCVQRRVPEEESDEVFETEKPQTPPESEIGLEKQRKLSELIDVDKIAGDMVRGEPEGKSSEDSKSEEGDRDTKLKNEPAVTKSEPRVVFEPGRDCELLFSLLNEREIDDSKIFDVLLSRSHRQRLQLRMKYQILYRQDLVRELRNNLSPAVEIVLGALTLEMVEFDALCIHQAVSGIAIDDRTLVNILVSRDPVHLKAVKIKFWQVYGKDLIDYLRRVTNSELGELLLVLSCLREGKSPSHDKEDKVTEAAQRLAKKLSSGERSYLDVFHKKSGDDIHKVFRKYSELTGKDVSESFEKYKSGEVRSALIIFADYLNDHTMFYVHQLKSAMTDPGVDGIILIHIIVSRSEIDLGEIKSRYHTEYGITLEDDLRQHCTADYGRTLLALLKAKI